MALVDEYSGPGAKKRKLADDEPSSADPAEALNPFRFISEQIRNKILKADEISAVLERCTLHIAGLTKEHQILSNLFCSLWTHDELEKADFDAYEKFVTAALISEPMFLHTAVKLWCRALLDGNKQPVHEHLLWLLVMFSETFPASKDLILQAFAKNVPLMRRGDGSDVRDFVIHAVKIGNVIPGICKEITALAVQTLARFDARVSVDMKARKEEEEVVVRDQERNVGPKGGEAEKEEESHESKAEDKELEQRKACLDESCSVLMQQVMQRVRRKPSSINSLLSGCGQPTFLAMDSTTHVQYVLLAAGAVSVPVAQRLLDWLWESARSVTSAPRQREIALGHLASLLCRASYLRVPQRRACLEAMVQRAQAYVTLHCGGDEGDTCRDNSSVRKGSMLTTKRHRSFFATCQAVFYVIAFNHRDLARTSEGLAWLHHLGLEKLVSCSLNPLRHCCPSVVKNFANVMRHYQVLYCYSIIERNARIPRADLEWDHRGGMVPCTSDAPLDTSFFPYDQDLMPRCMKVVEPYYVQYDMKELGLTSASAEHFIAGSEDAADLSKQKRSRRRTDTEGSSSWTEDLAKADAFDYSCSPGFKAWQDELSAES